MDFEVHLQCLQCQTVRSRPLTLKFDVTTQKFVPETFPVGCSVCKQLVMVYPNVDSFWIFENTTMYVWFEEI